jgi:hypothetical protein
LGQNEHPTTETYGAFVSALRIIHETVCLYMNLKPTYLEKTKAKQNPNS